MKRTFEIEFDDDCGPLWMNKTNLLTCLTNTCRNSKFTVRDLTGDQCDPSAESAGPLNPRFAERQKEKIISAVAGAWCTPANANKVMDPDLCQAAIDNVMAAIEG
jgi:hypothetical protein